MGNEWETIHNNNNNTAISGEKKTKEVWFYLVTTREKLCICNINIFLES